MPPKRKAAAAKTAAAKKAKSADQAKTEPEPSGSKVADKVAKLTAKTQKKVRKAKMDSSCTLHNGEVYGDFDAMLNQTNIGNNNNKYYIIQLLTSGASYYTWNRWGRVGEPGQNSLKSFGSDVAQAIKDFEKKFRDKTKNAWVDRDNFQPCSGKYTLLEMEGEEEEDEVDARVKEQKLAQLDADIAGQQAAKTFLPCQLDKETQALISLIFDGDTFQHCMKELKIDTKKMPLGKLSKPQLAKGYQTLEQIELLVEAGAGRGRELENLCSQFYTIIPHDFGRQRPPVINDLNVVHKKYEMLNILADMEIAQEMKQEQQKRSITKGTEKVPHHLDVNYELLKCDLKLLSKTSKEFQIIKKYTEETKGGWRQPKIVEVWAVDRHKEEDRFEAYSKMGNRKLLWHGTNVAVVAAILKTGLRIMPHSGGRVGKGIYFASENGKSAGYVGTSGGKRNLGIMFLNEVVLGKEYSVTENQSQLKSAPKGYDSVVARGQTEPDPKLSTTLEFGGNDVVVPQGKPKSVSQYSNSHFSQSEYLIYNEAQNRIRYLLLMEF